MDYMNLYLYISVHKKNFSLLFLILYRLVYFQIPSFKIYLQVFSISLSFQALISFSFLLLIVHTI